jgi:hypothetical protein
MKRFVEHWRMILHAAVSFGAVAMLGVADYTGFALFGETPEQQRPNHQSHFYQRFHK